MKVAVVGLGLIGRERVNALRQMQQNRGNMVWAVCDPFLPAEQGAIENAGGRWFQSYQAMADWKPDWVIIATPHDVAESLTAESLALGSRVLLEKPFARSLIEAERLMKLRQFDDQLWIGFNYRFFRGVAEAISDARVGLFGPLISATFVLGHGGAPGMELGWKFNPDRAGGGALIDPGIHILDLCHQLVPDELNPIGVSSWSGFWRTGIEEEIHLLLRSEGVSINVQVSIVRWRSVFRMELHGCNGYGIVIGRGRSYGPQLYLRGKRWGWQDAVNQEASEEQVSTTDCQSSFVDEMTALFYPETAGTLLRPCSADEGLQVMRTYEACRNLMQLQT
jgi:predicted dehydrogenase